MMQPDARHNRPMKLTVAFGARSLSAGRYVALTSVAEVCGDIHAA
jgi:hypothetical protein